MFDIRIPVHGMHVKDRLHKLLINSVIFTSLFLNGLPGAQADFSFNWGSSNLPGAGGVASIFPSSCHRADMPDRICAQNGAGVRNTDESPWLNEYVIDVNGDRYFHMVIGNPADAFKQETYVRTGTLRYSAWIAANVFNIRAPSDSGGDPGFASGPDGLGNGGLRDPVCGNNRGNSCDPLAKTHTLDFAGNGSGNPTHVLMRQVLVVDMVDADPVTGYEITNLCAGEFCQEFRKTSYTRTDTNAINADKPLITQRVNDSAIEGDISLAFQADMRALAYSDMDHPLAVSGSMGTSGTFVNTLLMTNTPGLADHAADFDMSQDTQTQASTVTAGRYTFTPGTGVGETGWNSSIDPISGQNQASYDPGSYTYFEGGYNPLSENFKAYCDPAQHIAGGQGC